MRDSSFVESTARSALVVSQRPVSKRWTNGLQCCEKPCRKTTTGLMKFWPTWKKTKKEKRDEQTNVEDRRRYTCGSDQALRCAPRGRVPRPHGSETSPEMDAWSGRLDDARLPQ